MKTTLYMVRHAESPYSDGTERTRGLTDKGWLAVEKVTEVLMGEGIDRIVSSPYARAILTVEGLAKQLNLTVESYENLRERHFMREDIRLSNEEFMTTLISKFDDLDFAFPGGESNRECQRRAVDVLSTIIAESKGKKIVIGTHGNVMTMMMKHFDASYGYDFLSQTSKPDIYKLVFDELELVEVIRLWEA